METLGKWDRVLGTWALLADLFEHTLSLPGIEPHPFEVDVLVIQNVLLDAVIPAGLIIGNRYAIPFRYSVPDRADLVGTHDAVASYMSCKIVAVKEISRLFGFSWTEEVQVRAAGVRVMAKLLYHAWEDGTSFTWRKHRGWDLGAAKERNIREHLAGIPVNRSTHTPADRGDVWLMLPTDYTNKPPSLVLAAVHLDGGVWAGPEFEIFAPPESLLGHSGSPPIGVWELWEASAPPRPPVRGQPSDQRGKTARDALLDSLARRGLLTAHVRRGLRKLLASRVEMMEEGLADDATRIRKELLGAIRCLANSKPDPVGPTGVVFRGYYPLGLPRIEIAPGEADLPSGPPKIDAIVESCVLVAREDLVFLHSISQGKDLFDALTWVERSRWVDIERRNGWWRLIELN